jgi:hypothetical protein
MESVVIVDPRFGVLVEGAGRIELAVGDDLKSVGVREIYYAVESVDLGGTGRRFQGRPVAPQK